MFTLAGSTPAAAEAAANSVFDFEKRLAEASLDNVALRDPVAQDHKTPFEGLAKMAPDFDWAAYFDGMRVPHIDFNVTQPKFVQEFDHEMATATIAQWRDYLRWHVLDTFANALSEPFVEQNFAFNGKYLSGATEMKPRWKRCAEATDAQLGDALGKAYVQKYFPPEAKARTQEMVRNILLALHEAPSTVASDWMSPETKAKALEKLASFHVKVGYPDQWKNYAGVSIGRDSYYDDFRRCPALEYPRQPLAINRQAGRSRPLGHGGKAPPTSMNAYYNPSMNEIVFPAGILQPPAFDITATDAVNYGAIGVVIGHEISHGFDDQGAQYDGLGRLSNWWTPADHQQFDAHGQCVVKQFDGYFIEPGVHHNGKLVLGESIADLGGAKLAYLGYQKSREGKGPEPTIDGFTPEQQFFLAWGQWRGDETRMETQRTMVQGDPHPVAKFRTSIHGPLSEPACVPAGIRLQGRRCDGEAGGGSAAGCGESRKRRIPPSPPRKPLSLRERGWGEGPSVHMLLSGGFLLPPGEAQACVMQQRARRVICPEIHANFRPTSPRSAPRTARNCWLRLASRPTPKSSRIR